MADKTRKVIGWLSALALVLVLGIGAFMLLGAAGQTDEVLQVEAAVFIDTGVANALTDGGTEEFVHLYLAVTSPTRGPVDQLRGQNIEVRDAWHVDPGGVIADPYGPTSIQFKDFFSLGGGFYRIDIAPDHCWSNNQEVILIEIHCPWGRGITVCELPIGATGREAVTR